MGKKNTMVARVTLQKMRQDPDKPVHAYGARIKGKQVSASTYNNVQDVVPTSTTQKPYSKMCLIDALRQTFATYCIPDELSSDGGLEFIIYTTRHFLHNWGFHHCLSSIALHHSNFRAEVGVKTVKMLISGNIGKN